MDQDLCKFTRSEDEFWYQIDVVVPGFPEFCGYGLVWAEFAVELGAERSLIDEIRLI